jgi:hypothetical protein
MNSNKLKKLLQIILPISLGVIIYALFREVPIIDPEGDLFPFLGKHYNHWLIGSLPDGLWLYSLNASFLFIWNKYENRNLLFWICISLLISISIEFLQSMRIVNGTFDFNDICLYIAASTLFLIINFKKTSNVLHQ